jgi:glutamine---fructose-6-phosphate transaminase (isomerizing)
VGSPLALPAVSRMAAEIRQVPAVVSHFLADAADELAAAAGAVERHRPRWVMVAGRGTSDNAGTYGRYLVETQLRLPAGLAAPSVATLYEAPLRWREGLLICVSQSGRSPDLVTTCEMARRAGALTLALVNDVRSPLAAAAEMVIDCRAGEERSVAATKTYIAQLAALAALIARLRPETGLWAWLGRLPQLLEECLAASERWLAGTSVVGEFAAADRALVASRGHNLATALEIALKLKETAAVFAGGYSTADLLHGPIALAGPAVPSLVFRPEGAVGRSVDDGLARLTAQGANPWIVAQDSAALPVDRERVLELPTGGLPESLTPLALALPGQLLAEAVARARGFDPDRPPGLSKITLTR